MSGSKPELRTRTWAALRESGDARFPGTVGRIPNFRGAEAAADRLAQTDAWKQARVIKCNPDSPQRPVRHRALRDGKVVLMAVPRLAGPAPFLRLDPARLDRAQRWEASSIVGADRLGEPLAVNDVPPIDLIVTGCVGVTSQGARLGKGGGYSDLELALLTEWGLVGPDMVVATTVHEVQVLPDGAIPVEPHDQTVDLFCTPVRTVACDRPFARPTGVDASLLDAERIDAMPPIARLLAARAGDPEP